MGFNYRCSSAGCRKRATFKHLIDWYQRRPKCPGCKKDSLKPVYVKEHARSKRRGCFCQGRWWPHNKGRIEDENHVCIYVEDPEGRLLALAMNAETTVMKSGDECPF